MKYVAHFNQYRTFGVEIEFKISNSSGASVANQLSNSTNIAVSYQSYNHTVQQTWKLITDASVPGGFELVSPVLSGAEGLDQMKKLMAALRAMGGRVDRQCGFHVHHNAADLTAEQLVSLVVFHTNFEPVLDLFHPVSRRGNANTFCLGRDLTVEQNVAERIKLERAEAAKRRLFDDIYGNGTGRQSRYRKLNTRSFASYGTIEFRQHAGTLNGTKAANWVVFTQLMVEKAKCGIRTGTRAKTTLGELNRALRIGAAHDRDGFTRDLAAYYLNRARDFGYEED